MISARKLIQGKQPCDGDLRKNVVGRVRAAKGRKEKRGTKKKALV
jgi:hypothetical protein